MFELPADAVAGVERLRRYRRPRAYAAFAPPMGLLCARLLEKLVANGDRVSMPHLAAKYMLDTVLWRFSPQVVAFLIRVEHRSIAWLPVLLAIYYAYHVALVGLPLTGVVSMLLYLKDRLARHEEGKVTSTTLMDAMTRYTDHPSVGRRLALSLAARTFTPSRCASPVEGQWVNEPAYQWFRPAAIARPDRDIVLSLGRFKDSLFRAISRGASLDPYRDAVAKLQEFFFVICARSSKRFSSRQRRRAAPMYRVRGREIEALREFAALARPLILAGLRTEARQGKPSRLRQLASGLIQSRAVHLAGALSSAAALVMTLGVLLFGIDLPRAFLTWFTVTFGSFAVSVGVTSVAITRSSRRSEGDEDSGPQE